MPVSDDSVSVPVLSQDFPKPGETFLSFNTSSADNVPESGQPEAGQRREPKEEKHEGAGAFVPGLSSTRRGSRAPSEERKDVQRQQMLKFVLESESLTPQQKEFMMNNLMREFAEEEGMGMQSQAGAMTHDMDSLAQRFHLKIEETGAELFSAPQPYSGQYHTLPDVKLPNFYGNPLEFHKFYAMFTCLVDRNPKIPKIMKLHLLSSALKGTANYLTHQITFSPGSYDQLKRNLEKAFGDTEASLSQLRERLIAFPMVPENRYKDLAQFFGFATNYVMSLLQYEDGATLMLGPFVTTCTVNSTRECAVIISGHSTGEETLRGKMSDRNRLDFMLDWMEKQVSMARTFYHADPSNPKIKLGQPSGIAMEFGDDKGNSKKKDSKGNKGGAQHSQKSEPEDVTTVLATDTVAATATNNMGGGAARGGRGTGRGRGGAPGDRGRGGGRGRGRGRGSTPVISTSKTDQSAMSDKDNREREVIPCCFCNNPRHSSNHCTQKMKPDTMYVKALEPWFSRDFSGDPIIGVRVRPATH